MACKEIKKVVKMVVSVEKSRKSEELCSEVSWAQKKGRRRFILK